MSARADIIGLVFGRLKVIDFSHSTNNAFWKCKCECGNEKIIRGSNLTSGQTTSCGCYVKENSKKVNTKHGMINSNTYYSWTGMLARCNNENVPNYKNYGGRGITVCDRWREFTNFLKDMGERPNGLTLDRKDVNGNYEPDNCKWSTNIEQHNNTRRSLYLTMNGETMTAAEWARKLNMDYKKFYRKYVLKQNVAI